MKNDSLINCANCGQTVEISTFDDGTEYFIGKAREDERMEILEMIEVLKQTAIEDRKPLQDLKIGFLTALETLENAIRARGEK